MNGIDFGGSVESREADTSGDALDTTANNSKEQDEQDRATDEMEKQDTSNDDDTVDTSDDDFEDEGEDDDSDEESDDEADDDEESESDEDDESDEDSDDSEEDESEQASDEEAPKDEQKKSLFDPKEETNYQKAVQEIESDEALDDTVKEQKIVTSFLEMRKDVFPEQSRLNFQKYVETGNDAFIHMDDNLYKFVKEVKMYNVGVPLSDRLSRAAKVAFSDKIAKVEQSKGKVKAEVRAQKVNKSVSNGTKTNTSKGKTSGLNAEQKKAMSLMGISEEDYNKFGK